jgi:hypothetical protein
VSEGKGYRVIVKLNAAPVKQYASGNSVIFQGDTTEEVATLIAKAIPGGNDDNGALILAYLAELALVQATGAALSGGNVQADVVVPGGTGAAAPAAGDTTSDPDGPPTAAALAVAKKKTGKTDEELAGLTKSEVKALIASAK